MANLNIFVELIIWTHVFIFLNCIQLLSLQDYRKRPGKSQAEVRAGWSEEKKQAERLRRTPSRRGRLGLVKKVFIKL